MSRPLSVVFLEICPTAFHLRRLWLSVVNNFMHGLPWDCSIVRFTTKKNILCSPSFS